MLLLVFFINSLFLTTNVIITEPLDGETYLGDWLPLQAHVENENTPPDSVGYSLNGESLIQVSRLNTDWPTYMQNNQNHGYSESPAPLTNEVLWTAPVTSCMHEFPNPIVVNGIVYYPSNSGDNKLHALAAGTGEEIWSVLVGWSDDPPSYDNGYLYQASDSIFCIDALTGEIKWTFGEANGQGSTPCVLEDRLLVGVEIDWMEKTSKVFCLSKESGEVIWYKELNGALVSCTSAVGNTFFVPTYMGPLYAINAQTGDIIWENNSSPDGYWDSSPVIIDNSIFIAGEGGTTYCFDKNTGEDIWSTPSAGGGKMTSTPGVFNNTIIVGTEGILGTVNGMVTALNQSDGSMVWSIENSIHGSFAVADGIVFWGSATNPYSAVFAADANTGEIIWEYEMIAGPYGLGSTPSVTDGVMYFAGTDSLLYAFGTGLKYSYRSEFIAPQGLNELIVTSYVENAPVAADTINFTVAGTGLNSDVSSLFNLSISDNPFSLSTSISFELSEPALTSINIFDIAGRNISTLVENELTSGRHLVLWDGCSQNGSQVPNGFYICKIESDGVIEAINLCKIK